MTEQTGTVYILAGDLIHSEEALTPACDLSGRQLVDPDTAEALVSLEQAQWHDCVEGNSEAGQ